MTVIRAFIRFLYCISVQHVVIAISKTTERKLWALNLLSIVKASRIVRNKHDKLRFTQCYFEPVSKTCDIDLLSFVANTVGINILVSYGFCETTAISDSLNYDLTSNFLRSSYNLIWPQTSWGKVIIQKTLAHTILSNDCKLLPKMIFTSCSELNW